MLCEVPLTKEQQAFATAHHSLVYKFLNENRLPEDEFYDVVIFGYLKAVRDYFSDLTAQQFTFSTIANRRMKFCLFDYFRTQERRKRNMEVLSIHVGLYPDGAPLEDTIPAHDAAVGNGSSAPRTGRQSIQAANGYCASETGRLWYP